MFCPECGHPTDPAPFDRYKAHQKRPGMTAVMRRICARFLAVLGQSPKASDRAHMCSLSTVTADHRCKEGTSMALHHAAPGEVMKLRSISDPGATTSALVKTDSFETIHLIVRAGDNIPDHRVDGSMSLYCIEGETAIDTPEGERLLRAGDWLYLAPGAPHAVRGITDAGLILTILFDRAE